VIFQVLTLVCMKVTHSSGIWRYIVLWKYASISEMRTAFLIRAHGISEVLVYFYETTQRHIPEDFHLQNFCSLPDLIRLIKSRRMEWEGHAAHAGTMRNAYKILISEHEGKSAWKT
jgi:hypothetical protein